LFRNQGFESRAFPTKFIVTRPRRRGPRLSTAMLAVLAGAACLIGASKLETAHLSELAAWALPVVGPSAKPAVAAKSGNPRREIYGQVSVTLQPASSPERPAATPLPPQKPDIAVTPATTTSNGGAGPDDARNALASARSNDIRQTKAEPSPSVDNVPAPRPRQAKPKRREKGREAAGTYVYLYDYVTPDGRREPVYRRVRGPNRVSPDDAFASGVRGYAPVERRRRVLPFE
jgi:hypothetical protein